MSFKSELSPKAWSPQPAEELSTLAMDRAVEDLAKAKEVHDEAQAAAKVASEAYEKARAKVLEFLNAAQKSRYHVDGIGLVSVVNNKRIKLSDDLEARQKTIDFVSAREGLKAVTINYQTLNRIYKECALEAEEKGEVFEMPGAGVPEVQQTISFRRR